VANAGGNLFLGSLPYDVREILQASFEPVTLKIGDLIYDYHADVQKIYFPNESIVSVVVEMANGAVAEVGVIGREGMTGLSIILGNSSSPQRYMVQVPGTAQCIGAKDFRAALERSPELAERGLQYAQATLLITSQLTACNALHSVNARCARWLLMAHDRVRNDLLLLTQEYLSQMLGVRRASVTIAASALQESGFISYTRGHILIRNRAGLESSACECYKALSRIWTDVMQYPVIAELPITEPLEHY
jgi:CRP-like cAMP-binding protein